MKGLICDIFRPAYGGSSNGGISEFANRVTLVGTGIPEIFEVSDDAPAVWIDERAGHRHVRPVAKEPSGHVGPMFGGTFIYTSDSRFPADYPLPLHDRYEWQANNSAGV